MRFIGHRGDRKRYRENTLEAFRGVLEHPGFGKNVVGVELDIQLTRDGRIAVFHDRTILQGVIKRMPVCDLSLADLRDAVARDEGIQSAVPTIEEVFDVIGHRALLLVEMKKNEYDSDRFLGELKNALMAYKPDGDVILHSFSRSLLGGAIPAMAGMRIPFGLLFDRLAELETAPAALLEAVQYLHPEYKVLLRHSSRILEFGLPIHTWTVNDQKSVSDLQALEGAEAIQAIMTDDLDLALPAGEA